MKKNEAQSTNSTRNNKNNEIRKYGEVARKQFGLSCLLPWSVFSHGTVSSSWMSTGLQLFLLHAALSFDELATVWHVSLQLLSLSYFKPICVCVDYWKNVENKEQHRKLLRHKRTTHTRTHIRYTKFKVGEMI